MIDEFSRIKHTRGVLSMGKFDAPHRHLAVFMLLGDPPFLGRVVKGSACCTSSRASRQSAKKLDLLIAMF